MQQSIINQMILLRKVGIFEGIKKAGINSVLNNYIQYHFQVSCSFMKNEEAEEDVLANLESSDSQPNNPSNLQTVEPIDPPVLFDEEFVKSYKELLPVKEKIKKDKIIKALEKGGIEYQPTEKSDHFELNLIRSTQNLQAITVKCYMGPFATILNIYRTDTPNQMHSHQCLYGNSGNVYLYKLQGQSLAVKCMQINKKQSTQITVSKFVLRAIKEYFFAKIASILKVGPKLIRYQEFDLIFHGNCIQFWMEQCRLIEDQNQRYQSRKQLAQRLRILHQIYIVHCDIKVQNIAYSPAYKRPIFIDFGGTKVLNRGPGYKFPTYFFGTLDYCSLEMQKLYVTQSKGYVDLYFNDAHCFKKIFRDAESRSTCTPLQNFVNDQHSQYDQYNAVRIKFLLYQNRLDKITAIKQIDKRFNEDILFFLGKLTPNEQLRDYYYSNWEREFSQSAKFRHLSHMYKSNKEYYFKIPDDNENKKKVEPDSEDWSLNILKTFLQRTISFDQLDNFQEEIVSIKSHKNRPSYFHKMSQFLNKITIKTNLSVVQTYLQFRNNRKNKNEAFCTFEKYLEYLNQMLEEDMKQTGHIPMRRIKDVLKRKALIKPYTHEERFNLIQFAKKIQTLDFLQELIQCRMLQYSFWETIDFDTTSRYSAQNIKAVDYLKELKEKFRDSPEQNVRFYATMIQILVFGEAQEIESLNKMSQAKDQANQNKKKMCQLAKLKILLNKKCFIQAKKVLFSNKSQFGQFRGLNIWHFFLFKLFHEEGSYEISKKILLYIDREIEKIADPSIIRYFFKKQREIYYNESSYQFFKQNFNLIQMNSLKSLNLFVKIFIRLLKRQEECQWIYSEDAQSQKTNKNSIYELILRMHHLYRRVLYKSMKKSCIKDKRNMEDDESSILKELKQLQQSYLYLIFYFNEKQRKIVYSQRIMQITIEQNKYLGIKHIEILDSLLKTLKFCKQERHRDMEQQLYKKIIRQNDQTGYLKEKANSFTYMFIFNYAFQKTNFVLFKNLLLNIVEFVDKNPTKTNLNHYISCLRYLFSYKFDVPQLTFINNILKSLNFDRFVWKNSYIALFNFEFILKLARILDEKQLKTEIYKASKFLPYINLNCVKWVQNILYPLVLSWNLKARCRSFLLKKARKNVRFYAQLTKKKYKISQIAGQSLDIIQRQTEYKSQQTIRFKILKFYTSQLHNYQIFFMCKGTKKTKIGILSGPNKRIKQKLRQKLIKYHQNCQNLTLKRVKQYQEVYLFRLALQ